MNSVFGIVVTAAGIPLYYYFRWKYKNKKDNDAQDWYRSFSVSEKIVCKL